MEKDWITVLQRKDQIAKVLDTNQETARFGLALSEEEAAEIVAARDNVLKEQRRLEFGPTIVPKIIYAFCDSAYIERDNYADTILRLQEMFFTFRNETMDEMSDDELLGFMREQFENVCSGDLDYLESTVLPNFAEVVREGYRGYKSADGRGAYEQFDEVKRWDEELYRTALKDLVWK